MEADWTLATNSFGSPQELKALRDISGDLGQLSHLNSSLCIFELLETKLHYGSCLKSVSNTVNNRYKGNHFTMKRSTIFTGGRLLK
jgi:hypothetical protein